MNFDSKEVAYIFAWLLAGFAARCVPFVAFAVVSRKVAWDAKLIACLLFATTLLAADTLGARVDEVVLRAPVALAYFAVVSAGMYALQPLVARGRLWPPVVFAVAAVGYVVLPAVVIRDPSVAATIVVGWEAV